jgi:hypothetical protein
MPCKIELQNHLRSFTLVAALHNLCCINKLLRDAPAMHEARLAFVDSGHQSDAGSGMWALCRWISSSSFGARSVRRNWEPVHRPPWVEGRYGPGWCNPCWRSKSGILWKEGLGLGRHVPRKHYSPPAVDPIRVFAQGRSTQSPNGLARWAGFFTFFRFFFSILFFKIWRNVQILKMLKI